MLDAWVTEQLRGMQDTQKTRQRFRGYNCLQAECEVWECGSVHGSVFTWMCTQHLICLPAVLPFARSGTSTCFGHESPWDFGGVVATVSAARATAACSPIVSITACMNGAVRAWVGTWNRENS
jgi:hypothetical protein